MELKIGQVFEVKGNWYQFVECNGTCCDNCVFNQGLKCMYPDISMQCARFFRTDGKNGHAVLLDAIGGEQSWYYTDKGILAGRDEYDNHKYDLMMLPEKKEGWAVIRRSDIYENEEQAKEALLNSHTAMMVRKITWEE